MQSHAKEERCSVFQVCFTEHAVALRRGGRLSLLGSGVAAAGGDVRFRLTGIAIEAQIGSEYYSVFLGRKKKQLLS